MTRIGVIGVLAFLATAGPLSAQPATATGTVGGLVAASTGTGLPGVVVTLRNASLNLERVVQTQNDGTYVFNDLPAQGTYEIQADLAGFATVVHSGIAVVPNTRLNLDFTLYAATAEALVVTGRVATLDHERSTVQQVVNETLVHSLPLIGRDFLALASLTAGMTGSPTAPSPQGQFYWTNNVVVDGASHYSKWRGAARTFYSGYGLETIREVQVLTSQFSAEFGEALATVTVATTNSGTNTLHGSALLFVQDDALNDIPAFTPSKPPFSSQRFGATLGGPVSKDRTHFFTSYEGRRSRGQNIVTSPAVPAGTTARNDDDEHVVFFKVDHKATQRDSVTARYNGQWFRWHNEPGGLTLPGTGIHYTNDVQTVLVSDTTLISTRVLNQLRFQFARYVDRRTDINRSVFVSRAGYSAEGGTLGPYGFGADPEDTWEGSDTLSYRRAAHAIKIGGGLKYIRAHNQALLFGRGAYFFQGSPMQAPLPFQYIQSVAGSEAAATADPRSFSAYGFAQDDWSVGPSLTLNLGMRYDIERISNVQHYDVPVDGNNVQPRLGAAWEAVPGRLVVRGGFGVYTQQHLLGNINRVELEGADGTALLTVVPGSVLMPTYPATLSGVPGALPPRDIQVVNPGLGNPYSLQGTIGAEHSLWGATLSADAVYLRGRDLMSLLDTNAPATTSKLSTRSVAEADLTRPVLPTVNGYRKVVSLGNQGQSWYRAVEVKVDRSTGALQMVGSYTWAKAEDQGNYMLPEDSRQLDAEKARADNDIRHNLTVGLTWTVPGGRKGLNGLSLSALGQFRSNRPYTLYWGYDRYGTTQTIARPDGTSTVQSDARTGGRNTELGGTFNTIDVSLVKRFRFGAKTLEARGEAFNLLSATNYDEYVGSVFSPLFHRPISAFARRRIQLAAVARF